MQIKLDAPLAIEYKIDNPSLSQAEVEAEWKLERGALSKKGVAEIEAAIQRNRKAKNREKVPKAVGDDFRDSQANDAE